MAIAVVAGQRRRTAAKVEQPEQWWERSPMPVVQLKNGVRLGNLCIPWPLEFLDTRVLQACSRERASILSCDMPYTGEQAPKWLDVQPDHSRPLPPMLEAELQRLRELYELGVFEVLLAPSVLLATLSLRARVGSIDPGLADLVKRAVRGPLLHTRERNLYYADRFIKG